MLSALWWWLVVQAVALGAAPLCLRLFAPLADRGYGLSKAFGLLLFGYLSWLIVVLHLLPNRPPTLWLAMALILAGSAFAWQRDGASLLAFWHRRRGLLLLEEAIFALAYGGFLLIRSHIPDGISGTEKFMDFAFLNAVTRSTWFPPLDPWLAPSPTVPHPTINYYYFGYLIQALLVELTGVPPAVGFNLALALLFGLAAVGIFSFAYGLARDLAGEEAARLPGRGPSVSRSSTARARDLAGEAAARAGYERQERPLSRAGSWSLRAAWPYVAAGLLAVYQLLIAGNLWTALQPFRPSGYWQKDFWNGIGWNATRVLVIKQGTTDLDYTINEFPSFSFLLGDLHPHVLALPFVLLAVGLAYAWLLRPPQAFRWAAPAGGAAGDPPAAEEAQHVRLDLDLTAPAARAARGGFLPIARRLRCRLARVAPLLELVPGGMVLGSLYFLNSWDLPSYFLLAQAGGVAGAWWQARVQGAGRLAWDRALAVVVLNGALAVALYLPFFLTFKAPVIAGAGGLPLPLGIVPYRSLLSQFLEFWGAQLLLLAPSLGLAAGALGGLPVLAPLRSALGGSLQRARASALIAREAPGWEPALLAGSGLLLAVLAERAHAGALAISLCLAGPAGWVAWRLLDPRAPEAGRLGGRALAFACAAIGLGALLLAGCELLYIRDFYGGALRRMNTVFKFYYQAWLLFALGGSVAVFWAVRWLARRRQTPGGQAAFGALATAGALILLATLAFPIKATLLRTESFRAPASLDGMDWLRRFHPEDYAAATWLRTHGAGPGGAPPVILEASGGSYSEFARMATQTGFPTVLGWDQHERLWRGEAINAEVEQRQRDIDRIYGSATLAEARPLLEKYHVSYVVVGYLEQQKYGAGGGLAKFESATRTGELSVAFRAGQTTIYRVMGSQ
jgi:uncharacterized membrane protein